MATARCRALGEEEKLEGFRYNNSDSISKSINLSISGPGPRSPKKSDRLLGEMPIDVEEVTGIEKGCAEVAALEQEL